jgi:hypothetical protein
MQAASFSLIAQNYAGRINAHKRMLLERRRKQKLDK